MKLINLVLIAIVFLVAQPVFGQSRWVRSRFYGSDGAMLIYFGEDGKDVSEKLQTLMRTDEFAEVELRFRLLDATSQDTKTVKAELKASYNSTWALASSKSCIIAQGDKLPTAEIIKRGTPKCRY